MRSLLLAGPLLLSILAGCSGSSADPIKGLTQRDTAKSEEPSAPPSTSTSVPGTQQDPGPGNEATHKRVFVTSETFTPDLQGLAGADERCQDAASNAGLGGEWHAWLSSEGTSALDNVKGDGPWYLVDKATLAFPGRDSLKSRPDHAVDMDEHGTTFLSDARNGFVWTGTDRDGVPSSNCENWENSSRRTDGAIGIAFSADEWTWGRTRSCQTQASLYCFEQ